MRVKGVIMSLALHYWMRNAHHCSGPPVSEMSYTVSSGTLNSTIPFCIVSGLVAWEESWMGALCSIHRFLWLWHFWFGDRKGIWHGKISVCWFVGGDILTWSLLQLSTLTTFVILVLSCPQPSSVQSWSHRRQSFSSAIPYCDSTLCC